MSSRPDRLSSLSPARVRLDPRPFALAADLLPLGGTLIDRQAGESGRDEDEQRVLRKPLMVSGPECLSRPAASWLMALV